MFFRTDLALEETERAGTLPPGAEQTEQSDGRVRLTHLHIRSESAARTLHKPPGVYITAELPPFAEYADDENCCAPALARALQPLLPTGEAMVAGLGNEAITPDAVGPRAAREILATRRLRGALPKSAGLDGLRPVSVITPGVLGNTGVETAELLRGVVRAVRPDFLIVIDALAAMSLSRLGNTVQFSSTGLSPGSGVRNARPAIDRETMGVPVFSVGVPTVVDARTFVSEWAGAPAAPDARPNMIVTPRSVDLLIRRASHMVALAVNHALQPSLSMEELQQLMA